MKKETASVLRQERIAADIYSLELLVSFAGEVRPGQFVSLYTGDQIEFIRPYNDTYVYVFDPKTGQYGYTNCNYLVDPRTGRRGVAYPSI